MDNDSRIKDIIYKRRNGYDIVNDPQAIASCKREQSRDVIDNSRLGSYDKFGNYVIIPEVKRELINMPKLVYNQYTSGGMKIYELKSNIPIFNDIFLKLVLTGESANLMICEQVNREAGGYLEAYDETIDSIGMGSEDRLPLSIIFRNYNIFENPNDFGKELKDSRFDNILTRKVYLSLLSKELKSVSTLDEKDAFKNMVSTLKQGGDYGKKVLDEFLSRLKDRPAIFEISKAENYNKAINEVLLSSLEIVSTEQDKQDSVNREVYFSVLNARDKNIEQDLVLANDRVSEEYVKHIVDKAKQDFIGSETEEQSASEEFYSKLSEDKSPRRRTIDKPILKQGKEGSQEAPAKTKEELIKQILSKKEKDAKKTPANKKLKASKGKKPVKKLKSGAKKKTAAKKKATVKKKVKVKKKAKAKVKSKKKVKKSKPKKKAKFKAKGKKKAKKKVARKKPKKAKLKSKKKVKKAKPKKKLGKKKSAKKKVKRKLAKRKLKAKKGKVKSKKKKKVKKPRNAKSAKSKAKVLKPSSSNTAKFSSSPKKAKKKQSLAMKMNLFDPKVEQKQEVNLTYKLPTNKKLRFQKKQDEASQLDSGEQSLGDISSNQILARGSFKLKEDKIKEATSKTSNPLDNLVKNTNLSSSNENKIIGNNLQMGDTTTPRIILDSLGKNMQKEQQGSTKPSATHIDPQSDVFNQIKNNIFKQDAQANQGNENNVLGASVNTQGQNVGAKSQDKLTEEGFSRVQQILSNDPFNLNGQNSATGQNATKVDNGQINVSQQPEVGQQPIDTQQMGGQGQLHSQQTNSFGINIQDNPIQINNEEEEVSLGIDEEVLPPEEEVILDPPTLQEEEVTTPELEPQVQTTDDVLNNFFTKDNIPQSPEPTLDPSQTIT